MHNVYSASDTVKLYLEKKRPFWNFLQRPLDPVWSKKRATICGGHFLKEDWKRGEMTKATLKFFDEKPNWKQHRREKNDLR